MSDKKREPVLLTEGDKNRLDAIIEKLKRAKEAKTRYGQIGLLLDSARDLDVVAHWLVLRDL
jgi:predicted DNA-binding protein (UPF0278 family)